MFLRSIARPLLASWFIYGAVESIIEPEKRAARSAPVVKPVLDDAGVELDITDLVKVHGVATLAAATVLAVSKTPRSAGVALASLAAVTAAAGRPFWLVEDEEAREAERGHFFVNLSLLGGALLAATAGHSSRDKARAKRRRAKARDRRSARKRGA